MPIWYVRVATRGGETDAEEIIDFFRLHSHSGLLMPPWNEVMQAALSNPKVADWLMYAKPGEHLQVRRQYRSSRGKLRDKPPKSVWGCEYSVTENRRLERVSLHERYW